MYIVTDVLSCSFNTINYIVVRIGTINKDDNNEIIVVIKLVSKKQYK